jgi:DNA-binding NarL/FixJ family response regulator
MRPSVSARPARKSTLLPAPNLSIHAGRRVADPRHIWGLASMCDRAVLAIVDGMPLRCLIVDDNVSFRDEMCALLEEQGISVVGGAASGTEARQQIAELQPDVALVDIDLGGESGLELVSTLYERSSPTAVPNVILISTHDGGEYADLIEASPALGFLAKTDLSAATILQMVATVDGSAPSGPSRSDERPGT